MRIDLLLKYLCLVKSRSQAKKGVEKKHIRVGGRAVKCSHSIKKGDILEIKYPNRMLVVEIIKLPQGQVPRRERDHYIRIIREDR